MRRRRRRSRHLQSTRDSRLATRDLGLRWNLFPRQSRNLSPSRIYFVQFLALAGCKSKYIFIFLLLRPKAIEICHVASQRKPGSNKNHENNGKQKKASKSLHGNALRRKQHENKSKFCNHLLGGLWSCFRLGHMPLLVSYRDPVCLCHCSSAGDPLPLFPGDCTSAAFPLL